MQGKYNFLQNYHFTVLCFLFLPTISFEDDLNLYKSIAFGPVLEALVIGEEG